MVLKLVDEYPARMKVKSSIRLSTLSDRNTSRSISRDAAYIV
jgi:hypothetical protein